MSELLYYGLPLLGLAITSFAQLKITTNYSKYKGVRAKSGKRGAEVARMILDKHGLRNIAVEEVAGNLTDHYDPTKKVVRLSTDIYSGSSIASVSVAAHECGHAIQHQVGYGPLKLRSLSVPVANIGSKLSWPIIIAGLVMGSTGFAMLGVWLFVAVVFFQLITLPVEFDASHRAIKILDNSGMLAGGELSGSKKVLVAAALTYVAALFSTILQLLRLIMIVNSSRRD